MIERREVEITVHLAPQELRLAMALICNQGRVMTTRDLIECVWPDPDLEPDCGENSIRQLMYRLNKKGIRTVWRHGFTLE